MNKKTLEYAREQLKQLRQPALTGREHDEVEIEKMDEKRKRDMGK